MTRHWGDFGGPGRPLGCWCTGANACPPCPYSRRRTSSVPAGRWPCAWCAATMRPTALAACGSPARTAAPQLGVPVSPTRRRSGEPARDIPNAACSAVAASSCSACPTKCRGTRHAGPLSPRPASSSRRAAYGSWRTARPSRCNPSKIISVAGGDDFLKRLDERNYGALSQHWIWGSSSSGAEVRGFD